MSNPAQTKVVVHVEVTVDGQVTKTTTQEHVGDKFFRAILAPLTSPSNTPIRQSGGQNLISANGTSDPINGSFPRFVWARAYPTPVINLSDPVFNLPPYNAVKTVPAANGNWSFSQAKGNEIPGCTFDSISGGPNNSTLVVWYDYGGSPILYSKDSLAFHGYISGSGSGPIGSGPIPIAIKSKIRTDLASTKPILYATFTGDLGALGSIKLLWNGATWSGVSTASSGSSFSLLCLDNQYHFVSVGPATAFVVSACGDGSEAIICSMEGVAIGEISGRFEVTITE